MDETALPKGGGHETLLDVVAGWNAVGAAEAPALTADVDPEMVESLVASLRAGLLDGDGPDSVPRVEATIETDDGGDGEH